MEFDEKQEKKIVENLEELNESLSKQNSARSFLVKGMLYGVGFVIGTTILGAIVLGILYKLFGNVPIIGEYLPDSLDSLSN